MSLFHHSLILAGRADIGCSEGPDFVHAFLRRQLTESSNEPDTSCLSTTDSYDAWQALGVVYFTFSQTTPLIPFAVWRTKLIPIWADQVDQSETNGHHVMVDSSPYKVLTKSTFHGR